MTICLRKISHEWRGLFFICKESIKYIWYRNMKQMEGDDVFLTRRERLLRERKQKVHAMIPGLIVILFFYFLLGYANDKKYDEPVMNETLLKEMEANSPSSNR